MPDSIRHPVAMKLREWLISNMILAPDPKKNHFTTQHYLGAIALMACFLWAFWPVFWGLIQTWSNNEDYSHGFFIVPVVGYLIYKRQPFLISDSSKISWVGFICVFLGLVMYLAGLFSQFRILANFSFIITLWGILFFLFGFQLFKKYGWELFLLLFMLPIPSRLYAAITLPLQLVVTKVSFFALQFLGVPVYREGNILQLANTSLEVVNACSGLRSILTIIVLSFVMACLFFDKTSKRLLLIFLAIPLAMLSNFIRVIVIALFAQQGKVNFVDGVGHTVLGICLFAFCFFLLTSLAKMIEWILPEK